jgi:glutamine amidotransferase-like uncharacterized protein
MPPKQRFETFKMKHNATLFGSLFISAIVLLGLLSELARGEEPGQAGRIRIAVYEGEGVGASCKNLLEVLGQQQGTPGLEIVRIDAQAIRQGGLAKVDVLIHPGGSGGKQGRALEANGREAVRAFVKNGGGFVGICAGAYLATNDYSWSLGLIDAKVVDRKHWARGTGLVTVELSPAAQQFFGSKEKHLKIFYGQGPLLSRREWDDPLVPDYESLAVYRTGIAKNGAPEGVMPGTSAIVRTQFGNGRVFCFSAHPEMTDSLGHLVGKAVRWASK